MDFISNILKRPISLTLNDSTSSSDKSQTSNNNNSGSPLSKSLPGSPLSNSLIATAMNTSINANMTTPESRLSNGSLVGSGGGGSDGRRLDYAVMRPISPIQFRSDFSSSSSATSDTIEELLIQINDTLNKATLEDTDSNTNSNSNSSTYRSTPAELSPRLPTKSVATKLTTPTPTPAKTPIVSPVAVSAAGSAVFERNSTMNQFHIDPDLEAGIFEDVHLEDDLSHDADARHQAYNNFVGLTQFDESELQDFPAGLHPDLEEQLKLTFEEGLVSTLEATKSRKNTQKDGVVDKTHLLVNTDFDTPVSSDNEQFAECQSYHDIMNPMNDLINDETAEKSETEIFCSAVNSNNVTTTNFFGLEEEDPLNTTMENIPDMLDDESLRNFLPMASTLKGKLSLLEEFQQQQQKQSSTLIGEDEPMDVDMNLTLEYATNQTLEADYKLQQNDMKASVETLTPEKNKSLPVEEASEKPSILVVDEKSSANEAEQAATRLLEGQLTRADKSPNTTDESTLNHSSIIQETKVDSGNDKLQTTPVSGKSVPNAESKLDTTTMSMNSSHGSVKSSASLSPNFPIKQNTAAAKSFPCSPTGIKEKKETPFLEKSDYAQRKNSPPSHKIDNSRFSQFTLQPNIIPPSPPKSPKVNLKTSLNETVNKSSAKPEQTSPVAVVNNTTIIFNNTFDGQSPQSPISNFPVVDEAAGDNNKRRTFHVSHTPPKADLPADEQKRRNFQVSHTPPKADIAGGDEQKRRTFQVSHTPPKADIAGGDEQKRRTFQVSHTPPKADIAADEHKRRTFQVSQTPPKADIAGGDEQKRRTFQVSHTPPKADIAADEHNRRTFNVFPTKPKESTEESNVVEDNYEPMDIDDTLPLSSSPGPKSSPISTKSPNKPITSMVINLSPPLPALQRRPPIHGVTVDPFASPAVVDILSEKEQTKSNTKDEKDIFVEKREMDIFATPSLPSNPFDGNDNGLHSSDPEFESGANLILNPSDFDYLLTKGNNNIQVDRSSLLLKFDPLLGVPIPVNQPHKQQQQLQQLLLAANNNACLAPTIEEDEQQHNNSNQSFVVERPKTPAKTKPTDSAKPKEERERSGSIPLTLKHNHNNHPRPEAQNSKKDVTMSVDVIKDMNVDNDCNKSFENSNSQSDEKHGNFKMDELEKKIRNEVLKTEDIEKKLKDGEQREEALIKRITEKDKTISKMNGVIEAYEKAIAELIAEKEQLIQIYEKQLAEVKADRDSNYHHLTSLETTFSDLHVKYEKSKEMTSQLKSNEDALLGEKRQNLENLRLQEQRYEKMKNHAMQQLENANKKLESMRKEHTIETTKLKAQLKKEEISRCSISEQLQQKTRENEELVKICDELINGQGGVPGGL